MSLTGFNLARRKQAELSKLKSESTVQKKRTVETEKKVEEKKDELKEQHKEVEEVVETEKTPDVVYHRGRKKKVEE